VHRFDADSEALGEAILRHVQDRMASHPVSLGGPAMPEELEAAAGDTITPGGMGGLAALKLFGEVFAPACVSSDHPRYLSFIPCAPTQASAMFEMVVGSSGIYAGTWLEGAGAVYAENVVLRWIADLAGLPPEAGGAFVPGGTIGNLSALVTARRAARARHTASGSAAARPTRVAAQLGAHSSVRSACEVMDAELVGAWGDEHQRLSGDNLRAVLEAEGPETFFAVVATAGTTSFGIVDDLDSVARVCREYGIWFHVDGSYGGAGLAAPTVRHLFNGIEQADSLVVDPHKWLFAPYDCCALLYRVPALGRAAHAQKGAYVDVLTDAEWNPTEYAIGLTRRARGLPLWFSLAAHGTRAYTAAVERTMEVTRFAEAEIARRPYLQALRGADLSVVVFRRHGWEPEDYQAWSAEMLREELAFVIPASHQGETVVRFAIVNPTTSEDDIASILDTMA
jgi:L-2,4-diaminobutyrate decarboxylase